MPDSTGVAMTTALSILVILDIGGNLLVCAIIRRNQDMRYVDARCVYFIKSIKLSKMFLVQFGGSANVAMGVTISVILPTTDFLKRSL